MTKILKVVKRRHFLSLKKREIFRKKSGCSVSAHFCFKLFGVAILAKVPAKVVSFGFVGRVRLAQTGFWTAFYVSGVSEIIFYRYFQSSCAARMIEQLEVKEHCRI